jgi:hypothetical protein
LCRAKRGKPFNHGNLSRECTRNTNDSQAKFTARFKLSHDRYTTTLREDQFISLGLIISARLLALAALAVVNVRGQDQFKAHLLSALCAGRELVSRLEAGPVRQAVFSV